MPPFLSIFVVELSLWEACRWRSRLCLKVGSSWLADEDEDEQCHLWKWVQFAGPGELIHMREALLYEVVEREDQRLLLFNFETQTYEALRLWYHPAYDMEALD